MSERKRMREPIRINKYKKTDDGTVLVVTVYKDISYIFEQKISNKGEIRIDDGRHISAEQRKKAYATIRDLADFTGYLPEEMKELMKMEYIIRRNGDYISLSDCTMEQARGFINVLIEFALDHDIPLSEQALDRTDDIGRYLYYCLKTRHCCICGKPNSDIHHEDAIGMGHDRTAYDDRNNKKICLCREHHTIAHQRGVETFRKMYKVYGIKFNDDM